MAAALGVAPERLMESQRPALAQARKLKLAQMRGTQLWAAVLDEPANHREVPASERLEEALAAYRGALLLVTPDEHLAQR
jgi:ATPase subunit of ABC transporter with duplicated ATPase domains